MEGSHGSPGPSDGTREGRTGQLIAASLLGVTMTAVWTWWALADGAFFGTILLPGAIVIYLVLIVVLLTARLPVAMRGAHAIAFAGFFALAAWTALSILWSPAKDLALDYAQRGAVYAGAFALGLALAASLRNRIVLSVAPLLLAGTITAVVVLVAIWTSTDVSELVDLDGTLEYPFGYRNANALFFVLVAIAALPVLARPGTRLINSVGLSALASLCLAMAAISQSRGSLLALAVGLFVILIVCPNRFRALAGMVSVLVPMAIVFPEILDAFDAANSSSALVELQGAATASVIGAGIAGLLAVIAFVVDRQLAPLTLPRPSPKMTIAVAISLTVVALGVIIAATGNPVQTIGDRLDSISAEDESYGQVTGSRFTYSGGLNRLDFWEVALDQVADDPIAGGGAGSFRSAYLLKGNGTEEPRNAHSLPLEMLGELGVLGLSLLCLSFGFALWGAVRARRLGPECAALSTIAIAVTATVLAQAAVDWSWYFGALFAPPIALLGSAAAPAALALEVPPIWARFSGAVVAGMLALIAVPAFASERLTVEAAKGWRGDEQGAFDALDRAADLNPLAGSPLLVESEIARATGDRRRAAEAARSAIRREPDDWRGYTLLARALVDERPELAAEALREATKRNPNSDELAQLRHHLQEQVVTPK